MINSRLYRQLRIWWYFDKTIDPYITHLMILWLTIRIIIIDYMVTRLLQIE